jgi:hypothetical protein
MPTQLFSNFSPFVAIFFYKSKQFGRFLYSPWTFLSIFHIISPDITVAVVGGAAGQQIRHDFEEVMLRKKAFSERVSTEHIYEVIMG